MFALLIKLSLKKIQPLVILLEAAESFLAELSMLKRVYFKQINNFLADNKDKGI